MVIVFLGGGKMFLVFNKQKIYSYLVSLSTVVVLFLFAIIISNKSEIIVDTFSR